MTFPCAATHAERAFQGSLVRGERRFEATERERDRLMTTPEFDPFTVEHLAEALAELPAVDLARTSAQFKETAVAAGGGVLYYAVFNYWQRRAMKEAESIIAVSCPKCFGDGLACPSCDEDFSHDHRER